MLRPTTLAIAFATALGFAVAMAHGQPASSRKATPAGTRTVAVSGTAVDLLNTAIVHSKDSTAKRMVQRSTETVELTGDLTGRVLYQVTTEIDFVHKMLVNTGFEVFSGTVAGSAPVMLHDHRFRFEANLATGEERGRAYLVEHIAGPDIRCTLDVKGTGTNVQGNPTSSYTGECVIAGR